MVTDGTQKPEANSTHIPKEEKKSQGTIVVEKIEPYPQEETKETFGAKEVIIDIKEDDQPKEIVISNTNNNDEDKEIKRAKLIGCIIGAVLGSGLYWPNALNNAGVLAGLASFLSNSALTYNDLKKLWEEVEKVFNDEKLSRADKAKFIAKCLAKIVPIGLLGVPIVHLASAGPGFYKLLTAYVLSNNFKEEVLDRIGGPAATTVLLGIFSVIPISFVYISSFDNLCKSSVEQYYRVQYWRLKLQGKNPYKENKNILLNDIEITHKKLTESYNKVKGELVSFQKGFLERLDKKPATIEVSRKSDTKDEILVFEEELIGKQEKVRNLAKELHREYYLMYTPWSLFLTVEMPLKTLFLGNALYVGVVSSANASNPAKNLSTGWQLAASIYSLWPGLLNIGLYTLSAKNAVNYLIEILLTLSNLNNWTTLERLPRLGYLAVMTTLCLITSVAASPAALQVFGNALTSPALGWARGIVVIDTIFALMDKYGWISAMINSTSVNFRALTSFLTGIKKDLLSQKLAAEHKNNDVVLKEVKEGHVERVENIIKKEALLTQKETEYRLLEAKTDKLVVEIQCAIKDKDNNKEKIDTIQKQIDENAGQLDIIHAQKINIEKELAELTILKEELKAERIEKHKKELENESSEELKEKLKEKHIKELEEIEKGPSSDLQAAIEYAGLGESIANEITEENTKKDMIKNIEIINEQVGKLKEKVEKSLELEIVEIKVIQTKQSSYISCCGMFGKKKPNKHVSDLILEGSSIETETPTSDSEIIKDNSEKKPLLLDHDKTTEVIYTNEEPKEEYWISKNCLVM